jgi:rhodanese-related sulfurtransferase
MTLRKTLVSTLLLASLFPLAACGTPETAPDTAADAPAASDAMVAAETPEVADDSGATAVAGDAAAEPEAAEPVVFSGNPESPFEEGGNHEVPAAVVAEAIGAGSEIVFLDARDTLNFEAGHIDGAVNVPFFEVEKHLDKVPQDKWLVAYCACPTAEAKQLADTLMENGYTKVKVMQEGLDGWTDLGNELVKGQPSS